MSSYILYTYGVSSYDFLDIFDKHNSLERVVIEVGNKPTLDNWEHSALCVSGYNFAYMGNYRSWEPWVINLDGGVRIIDTKLFIINDIESAVAIFKLAKHCRQHENFYSQLFKLPVGPLLDNVVLSIATSIYQSPSGIFPIPEGSVLARPSIQVTDNVYFDDKTRALVRLTGVTTIE